MLARFPAWGLDFVRSALLRCFSGIGVHTSGWTKLQERLAPHGSACHHPNSSSTTNSALHPISQRSSPSGRSQSTSNDDFFSSSCSHPTSLFNTHIMFFPAGLGTSTELGMLRPSLSFPFLSNTVSHSVEIISPYLRTFSPLCSPSPPSFLSIFSAFCSNTLFPPSFCAHFPPSNLLSTQTPAPKPYHGHSHGGSSLPGTLLTFLLSHRHILILRLGVG